MCVLFSTLLYCSMGSQVTVAYLNVTIGTATYPITRKTEKTRNVGAIAGGLCSVFACGIVVFLSIRHRRAIMTQKCKEGTSRVPSSNQATNTAPANVKMVRHITLCLLLFKTPFTDKHGCFQ